MLLASRSIALCHSRARREDAGRFSPTTAGGDADVVRHDRNRRCHVLQRLVGALPTGPRVVGQRHQADVHLGESGGLGLEAPRPVLDASRPGSRDRPPTTISLIGRSGCRPASPAEAGPSSSRYRAVECEPIHPSVSLPADAMHPRRDLLGVDERRHHADTPTRSGSATPPGTRCPRSRDRRARPAISALRRCGAAAQRVAPG